MVKIDNLIDKLKSLELNFLKKNNPITKDNFYINSKVVFKEVKSELKRKPDYTSYLSFIIWDDEDTYIDIRRYDDYGNMVYDESLKGVDYAILDDDFENPYKVLDTFTGRCGDTGYKLEDDEVSSRYWYTKKGVYRESSHWGRVAQCEWEIDNLKKGEAQVGFANWKDFKLNN